MVNGVQTTGGFTTIGGESVLVTPSGEVVGSAAIPRRSRGGGASGSARARLQLFEARLGRRATSADLESREGVKILRGTSGKGRREFIDLLGQQTRDTRIARGAASARRDSGTQLTTVQPTPTQVQPSQSLAVDTQTGAGGFSFFSGPTLQQTRFQAEEQAARSLTAEASILPFEEQQRRALAGQGGFFGASTESGIAVGFRPPREQVTAAGDRAIADIPFGRRLATRVTRDAPFTLAQAGFEVFESSGEFVPSTRTVGSGGEFTASFKEQPVRTFFFGPKQSRVEFETEDLPGVRGTGLATNITSIKETPVDPATQFAVGAGLLAIPGGLGARQFVRSARAGGSFRSAAGDVVTGFSPIRTQTGEQLSASALAGQQRLVSDAPTTGQFFEVPGPGQTRRFVGGEIARVPDMGQETSLVFQQQAGRTGVTTRATRTQLEEFEIVPGAKITQGLDKTQVAPAELFQTTPTPAPGLFVGETGQISLGLGRVRAEKPAATIFESQVGTRLGLRQQGLARFDLEGEGTITRLAGGRETLGLSRKPKEGVVDFIGADIGTGRIRGSARVRELQTPSDDVGFSVIRGRGPTQVQRPKPVTIDFGAAIQQRRGLSTNLQRGLQSDVSSNLIPPRTGGVFATQGEFTGLNLFERTADTLPGVTRTGLVQGPAGPTLDSGVTTGVIAPPIIRGGGGSKLFEGLDERQTPILRGATTPAFAQPTALRDALGTGQFSGQATGQITSPLSISSTGLLRDFGTPTGFFGRGFDFAPPRGGGFGGFLIPPAFGAADTRGKRRKGKRRFRRVPSLVAGEFPEIFTASAPSFGEQTGLVTRPIIRRTKRRKRR